MQYRIQQAIHMTEYGMKTQHMVPFIEECPAEHLLTIALPKKDMSDREMMAYVSKHLDYCHQHQLSEELPLGSIIDQQQLKEKDYRESRYYVRLANEIEDSHYYLKPQGLYATILHEGFYDTIGESFEKLFDFIECHGYRIIGDAYEYEIHSYFTSQDIEQYLISLSIQVDKK